MVDDFDTVLEAMHRALQDFVRGDAERVISLLSARDDVTLANPFGGVLRGSEEVRSGIRRAAEAFVNGSYTYDEISRSVSADMGYVLEIERFEANLGGRETRSSGALRVTMIFRREGDEWKLSHRQADSLVTPRSVESLAR